MNVSCPECASVFRVDPAKVPEAGVRARCSVCGGIIPLKREAAAAAPPGAAPRRSVSADLVEMPEAADAASTRAAQPGAREYAESSGAAGIGAVPEVAEIEREAPVEPAGAAFAGSAPAAARDGGSSYDTAKAAPFATRDTPPFGNVLTAPSSEFSTPSTEFTAAPGAPSPRRPINPFLNNDPGMKAKRLARALVSDMITYQPQKREEGLRNGTLKQLFREEIKKSYEEYVEQVGRDVAEATAHFQDALNDILANGRKVF